LCVQKDNRKTQEKSQGLSIVYFGDGKGKTSAALGLILRASGYNYRIALIKFIKAWESGEDEVIRKKFPNVTFEKLGLGFVGILGDRRPFEEHREAARKALKKALDLIKSHKYDIVILDEILSAVAGKLLSVREVLECFAQKPPTLTLVLTGRVLPKAILKKADLVSEIKKIKHPYDKGIKAKKGIDF
jgi:cob(I)alamin adenosyltransferase